MHNISSTNIMFVQRCNEGMKRTQFYILKQHGNIYQHQFLRSLQVSSIPKVKELLYPTERKKKFKTAFSTTLMPEGVGRHPGQIIIYSAPRHYTSTPSEL
ncbi:hypothetical protein HanOQP8_Chr02g0052631 [Helianthus annuus]|nr:hypothetical protein HanOQP8_Chr02g0052631 [Helianthus annuus]